MLRTGFIGILCLLLSTGLAHSQRLLKLPYGLKWGDTQETMIAWASEHSLDLTIILPAKNPAMRILRAGPEAGLLPVSKATSLECHFLNGRLFEVTEHHAPGPELPIELFRAQFERTKKDLVREYGPLLTNRQERTVKNDFVTKTRSFHREPVKGLLLLVVFTELEDSLRRQRELRYSIVYRNDNFRKELEKLPRGK